MSQEASQPDTAAQDAAPDMSVLRLSRWLLRYALQRRGGLCGVVALMLITSGFEVLKPWPMKVLVDYVLKDGTRPRWLIAITAVLPGAASRSGLLGWCVGGTVALFLGGWALGVATSMSGINFGQRMVYDLAADLFAHLQRLSLRFHSRKSTGDLIRRVTSDTNCVSTIISSALLPIVSAVITLSLMLLFMCRLSPALTGLSLIVVPTMVLAFKGYAQPMIDTSYAQQEAEGRLYTVLEQTLSAMPVVQAFSQEARFDRRFADGAREAFTAAVRTTDVQLKFKILVGLASAVGTAGILWIGTAQVLAGRLQLGDMLVFLAYLSALYAPIESIMYTSSTIQGAAGSAKRVLEILELEPEVRDRPDATALSSRVSGHVQIDHVRFGYENSRPVLDDVSLDAAPGDLIAVVGPTGAGKTTLLGLIPRLFDPWQGSIRIDGHDVRNLRIADVRAQVSVVQQEPFLFPLSIAQNIAYSRPDAAQEQIIAAAKAANAHEFGMQFPAGYDTIIGERGATLSGGERQRISIARALLKDAPILILDEPTSALDAKTEQSVMEALVRLMNGRTVFVIAHRLSTVRRASKVVVVERGRIAECGTYDQLVRQGGLFARLHALQFGTDAEQDSGGI